MKRKCKECGQYEIFWYKGMPNNGQWNDCKACYLVRMAEKIVRIRDRIHFWEAEIIEKPSKITYIKRLAEMIEHSKSLIVIDELEIHKVESMK